MPADSSKRWTDPSYLRTSSGEPYLRIGNATLFVSNHDRSIRFYVDSLGFTLIVDHITESGDRWVAVAPPDGFTILELAVPRPGTDEARLVGRLRQMTFVAENVQIVYERWSTLGINFVHPPRPGEWGGLFTTFQDIDGNTLMVAGFEHVTQELELQRQRVLKQQEAERRSAQELEIARNVQMRLFPQLLPEISTLDYAGLCLQARAVGGDYYDFLDFGGHRLGLVIGDVAGKGIAAALLMVNLQANIRSHDIKTIHDPLHVLRTVNECFYANTNDSAYATLFFAAYDGISRRLEYVNCGHLCGLILRMNDTVERLAPTSTVLGLFPDWQGEIAHCHLLPDDTLVLYTDGITEASNDGGDEFGESGLIASLRRHHLHSARQIAELIAHDVKSFSSGEQSDDITLIVCKGRPIETRIE